MTKLTADLISSRDFALFQALFYDRFGLYLSEQKKLLLSGRLGKRIRDLDLANYRAYYDRIVADPEEFQVAINCITTNETHFFRESHQFDFLRDEVIPAYMGKQLRVWSAACSTGEEPYSIAMVLFHCMGNAAWKILATDINTSVLETAQVGLYPLERSTGIRSAYLKSYCLKGRDEYEGQFLIGRSIKEKIEFKQLNLTQLPTDLGMFQIIFLRNAIIYFDNATKENVLRSVCDHLIPDGWLFLGHSESLTGMNLPVTQVMPSIFRRI